MPRATTQPKAPRKSDKPRDEVHPGGRRSKLTPAVHEQIVTMIAGGLSFKDAARANGVGERTLHQWRSRGEHAILEQARRDEMSAAALRAECRRMKLKATGNKRTLLTRLNEEEDPYAQFAQDIEKAEAERKFTWLAEIATSEDWKAKAWMLERIYPHEFSRRTIAQLVGKDDGPIELADLTDDVKQQMAEKLAAIADRKKQAPLRIVKDDAKEEAG